jgi:hypothetical protein
VKEESDLIGFCQEMKECLPVSRGILLLKIIIPKKFIPEKEFIKQFV